MGVLLRDDRISVYMLGAVGGQLGSLLPEVRLTVGKPMAYTLVRTEDGCYSVSVCKDKARADDTVQRARDWIKANASNTGVSAPKISEGSVLLHLK
jgi:hypothetical protein